MLKQWMKKTITEKIGNEQLLQLMKIHFDLLQKKKIIVCLLGNMNSNVMIALLKKLEISEGLLLSIKHQIIGWDNELRTMAGSSLQTILLQIMKHFECPHEALLYVDCYDALLKTLEKIRLCRTYQVQKRGFVTPQELEMIEHMLKKKKKKKKRNK